MSAVDDLKSYGQIADAHADGIRKLTPAFQALYDSMSEVQKKNADLTFQALITQMAQTAVCNRHHSIDQHCAAGCCSAWTACRRTS